MKEAIDIKSLRQEMGLTQSEMAHRLGISTATIHNYEKGRNSPSPLVREKLRSLTNAEKQPVLQAGTDENSVQGAMGTGDMTELISIVSKQQETISKLVSLLDRLNA